MKICWLGVYRDGTGWGLQAHNYILALDSCGVDVVCRPIKLNNTKAPLSKRLAELEANPLEGTTHVVQHILPHLMETSGLVKNIGLYNVETSHFRGTNWANHLNLMDSLVVPCRHNHYASLQSGVTKPIRVVPTPIDTDKCMRSYPAIESMRDFIKDKFVFYTIGTFCKRKNLAALLRAFHGEFHPNEPVELILKLDLPGDSNPQKTVGDFIDAIKKGLRLHSDISKYKKEAVLLQNLPDEFIYGLHQHLDCYVSTSYGESVNLPCLDAILFGSTPIVPNHSGFVDYVTEDVGWFVATRGEPCFASFDAGTDDIYTSDENWSSIDIIDLQKAMRDAYTNKKQKQVKQAVGLEYIQKFSYQQVGLQLKKVLEEM